MRVVLIDSGVNASPPHIRELGEVHPPLAVAAAGWPPGGDPSLELELVHSVLRRP